MEPLFGKIALATALSVAIAYVLVTSLHITAGEQVPKIWAIVNAERVALLVARPLEWFSIAMRPFIAALNATSNGILRMLGLNASAEIAIRRNQ